MAESIHEQRTYPESVYELSAYPDFETVYDPRTSPESENSLVVERRPARKALRRYLTAGSQFISRHLTNRRPRSQPASGDHNTLLTVRSTSSASNSSTPLLPSPINLEATSTGWLPELHGESALISELQGQELDRDGFPTDSLYENTCPYFRKDLHQNYIERKVFRLKEVLNISTSSCIDGNLSAWYEADSRGDHAYIDRSEPRLCSPSCYCRSEDHNDGGRCIAFTVVKCMDTMEMEIRFHSLALFQQVAKAVPSVRESNPYTHSCRCSGFMLLRHRQDLCKHLLRLKAEIKQCPKGLRSRNLAMASRELNLLVKGLLSDPAAFESYSPETIARHGCTQAWRQLRNAKLNRDLDHMEMNLRAFDEASGAGSSGDARAGSNSSLPGPSGLEDLFNEARATPRPLVDPTARRLDAEYFHNRGAIHELEVPVHIHELEGSAVLGKDSSIGRMFVAECHDTRSSFLGSRVNKTRTLMVTELLQLGKSTKSILRGSKPEEQWLVVKALIDNRQDPYQLLKQIAKTQHFDVRTLCILQDHEVELDRIYDYFPRTLSTEIWNQAHMAIASARRLSRLNHELVVATKRNDYDGIRRALGDGADPSWGVVHAFENIDIQSLTLLIDTGADSSFAFSSRLPHHEDAVLSAALKFGSISTVHFLLDCGFYVDTIDESARITPLSKAIKCQDRALAKLLLDYGADVNRKSEVDGSTPLEEALNAGDSSIISMLLRRGARYRISDDSGQASGYVYQTRGDLVPELYDFPQSTVSTHSTKFLKSTHHPSAIKTTPSTSSDHCDYTTCPRWEQARHALERTFPRPEYALGNAALEGNVLQALSILDLAAELQAEANLSNSLLDMDATEEMRNELTPLMAAIWNDSLTMVKLLLSHGADVNALTSRGTALSFAAESNSKGIIRILLSENADLHIATMMLRSALSSNDFQTAMDHLNTTAVEYRTEFICKGINLPSNLRSLREEFKKEHANIMSAACAMNDRSTATANCRNPRKGWSKGLENHHAEAFWTGFETLRRLLSGLLPKDMNETLMFLGLAKAMSASLTERSGTNNHTFESDLARWQILFEESGGGQRAFRDAVNAIWQVNLDEFQSKGSPNEGSLLYFQELAASLIEPWDRALPLEDKQGVTLLESQEIWRLKLIQTFPDSIGKVISPSTATCESLEELTRLNAEFTASDLMMYTLHRPRRPPSITPYQKGLIALLMAGGIFAIIITYLITHPLIDLGAKQSLCPFELRDRKLETELPLSTSQRIVQNALDNIIQTVRDNMLGEPTAAACFESQIRAAVQHSGVSSFGALQTLLESFTYQWPDFRPYVATACKTWEATYDLQHTYSVICIYLGIPTFHSIIPNLRIHENPADPIDSADVNMAEYVSPLNNSAQVSTDQSSITPTSTQSTQSTAASGNGSDCQQTLTLEKGRQPRKTYCDDCQREFFKVFNYNKHQKDKHDNVRYHCTFPDCSKTFSRNAYRLKHELEKHRRDETLNRTSVG